MYPALRCFACSVIAFCFVPASLHGETLNDPKLGFTLELPAGAIPRPEVVATSPNFAHVYQIGENLAGQPPKLIFIERMGGTIGRTPLDPSKLPAHMRGEISRKAWHEFTVDCFAVPEELDGIKTVTYNVQIPLKREAIQLKVFGAADDRVELEALLRQLLDDLNGESNWLQSVGPAAVIESKNYGLILLAGATAAVVAGVIVLWLISRRAPKGTALLIAVVIYALGWPIAATRVRELLMLGGALKLLGFIGGIMGVVDLFRTRSPKIPAAQTVDAPDPNARR